MSEILKDSEAVWFDMDGFFEGSEYSDFEFDVEKIFDEGYTHHDNGTYERIDLNDYRNVVKAAVWNEVELTASVEEEDGSNGEVFQVELWGLAPNGAMDFVLFGAMRGNPETYMPERDGDFVKWLESTVDYYGYSLLHAEESSEGEWDVTVKMGHEPNVNGLS